MCIFCYFNTSHGCSVHSQGLSFFMEPATVEKFSSGGGGCFPGHILSPISLLVPLKTMFCTSTAECGL